MSTDITVNVFRAGSVTPTISNIYIQKDNLSVQEASYYGGASPYERFSFYTLATYDIRQTDLLIDTVNIDPKTTKNYQYRVINIPEFFPDMHGELVVDLVRGT
jgi:hypothetical protein